MGPDPFSICLFSVEFLKFGCMLQALAEEMRAYELTFQMAFDLFTEVDSTRKSTFCEIGAGARIDDTLQRIKLALENAERAISWTHPTGRRDFAAMDVALWWLKYKHIAEANKTLIGMCHTDLHRVRRGLERENKMRPKCTEKYFEDIRMQMWAVLSKRAEGNAILYSGVGVQMSRRAYLSPSLCFHINLDQGQSDLVIEVTNCLT